MAWSTGRGVTDRSSKSWGAAAAFAVLFSVLLAAFDGPPSITVSAAISLSDCLEEISRAYARQGGAPVRFNFAGSNVLSRQIVNGAPVDLFISADEAQMDLAARSGAIDVNTRVPLLSNRLAVVTMPRGPAVADIRALLQPSVRRIAIGDPAAVPAGGYARDYLRHVGLWEALEAKLVPVSNVRAALGAVENGSVDAAFTYESDAATAHSARAALIISGVGAPHIVYPAAIATAARNRRGAEALLAYLRGPAAGAVFRRYKFVPLEPGA
jgi:molybdate transport system substrate-binding protein